LLEIIKAAGWPIYFIILCSVIALAIIGERAWSLRRSLIAPDNLFNEVVQAVRGQGISPAYLDDLARGSLLGRIFAAGLYNIKSSREVMKDAIEDAGTTAVLELERFLNALGTISTVTPLLGLFGTVIGMIEIFASQSPSGANPVQMAQGISIALYNTGAGLAVAIPSLVAYRYFRKKVDVIIVEMEQQALKLVEVVHGERRA
jgi:biopolymer transport protein ExbB